jgi:signal transduction histidine kinase
MIRILPRTIQGRLMLSHVLVSLVSITLMAVYAGQVLFNAVRAQVEHHYEDLAFTAANDVEQSFITFLSGQADEEDVLNSIDHIFINQPAARYTLYLPDGRPVVDSTGVLPPEATRQSTPEIFDALDRSRREGEYFRSSQQGETFYLAVRIERDDTVYGVLHLVAPLEAALEDARQSLSLLVATALLVGLGISVLGIYLARGMAGPIKHITATAESLAQGELSARASLSSEPVEINRLAITINDMAGRLQSHVNELRSFVANASHELRTPLTSIKLRVEALRYGALDDRPVAEKFLAEIESEVDRLSSMVNDLLDLSRIEAGLVTSKRIPVNLLVVAHEVYEAFKPRAERAGIRLTERLEEDLEPVLGNEEQLRRMLYNLVDNGLKYTSPGGQVEISLQSGEKNGTVVLGVKDTGFGIAASQLPHIFERFYRVEATRPRFGPSQGSGLGLPIAKTIAETHGGQIGVSSQPGKGSTFWVDLPTAPRPAGRNNHTRK